MKPFMLVVLIAMACACASSGGTPAGSPVGSTLTVEGFAFGEVPQVVAGSTLTIDNQDSSSHTFTSTDTAWDEVSLAASSSSVFTVPSDLAPGDYAFHCVIHPSMTGTLTVTG